jgi:hypothetical protein
MLVLSGVIDYVLLGTFAGSTWNHIRQVLTETPPYSTSILIYPAVLLVLFIPPFSMLAFYLMGLKRFWREHRLLVLSLLFFIVVHTVSSSRQERYMLPIVPALVVAIVLALWHRRRSSGYFFRKPAILKWVTAVAIGVNVILLPVFTLNYSHKGVVEPLVRIGRTMPGASVMFVSPEIGQIYPLTYGGYKEISRRYVNEWSDLMMFDKDTLIAKQTDYYVVYPPRYDDLTRHCDSLASRVGPLELVFSVRPSLVDQIGHRLNPAHNPLGAAYVFRRPGG